MAQPTTAPVPPSSGPTQILEVSATQPATTRAVVLPPAEATRAYYKGVTDAIDRAITEPPANVESTVYTRGAKRIAALPKENVDPEVVAFSAIASQALTNAANDIEVGKQRAESRANAIASPSGDYGNDANRENRARNDQQNVNQQRRQAVLEERARAAEQAADHLKVLLEPRTKIAAIIVERYGPEPIQNPVDPK